MTKKAFVIGGTGAMGRYLIPELRRMGWMVDVLSKDDRKSDDPQLHYYVGNAKDPETVSKFLENGYDAIVDFMMYHTDRFAQWHEMLLSAAKHYIYLSSYRIYANEEHPVRETSPRLLEAAQDAEFLASDDYSLYKARGEDILKRSRFQNWTAIRPAITYSSRRFQLVTLEMPLTVGRALMGQKVVLPAAARDVQATMSWAGDVARMIAGLLLREDAFGETFSVCTAEHRTWGEIAEYYHRLLGLEAVWVSTEDFMRAIDGEIGNYWQLVYDRLFDRVMDNSKILHFLGWKQSDLMPLYDGLNLELSQLPRDNLEADGIYQPNHKQNMAMDRYLQERGL